MPRNPPWTTDELILALDLYFREGRKWLDSEHPEIIQLSQLLNSLPIHPPQARNPDFRNPQGVSMKLGNFLSLDPQYEGVGLESHKFHDLRHTFGVRAWLQTGDIYLVAQLMGHKSIATTQIYTRFFISRLQEDFPDLAGFAEDRFRGRAEILTRGNSAPVEKQAL